MIKLLLLVFVVMPSYNAHSHECYVKASYIVDQVQNEMAIPIVATKVPSFKEIPYHLQDEQRDSAFSTPSTKEPESVGHIDQHDYG